MGKSKIKNFTETGIKRKTYFDNYLGKDFPYFGGSACTIES